MKQHEHLTLAYGRVNKGEGETWRTFWIPAYAGITIPLVLLSLIISGCLDMQGAYLVGEGPVLKDYPPIIAVRNVRPHPRELYSSVKVGKNCRGMTFKIPPIQDFNRSDRFYYSWRFDDALVENGIVEPKARENSPISLTIDANRISEIFDGNLRSNFYEEFHMVEFSVNDGNHQDAHEGLIRWTLRLSDKDCFAGRSDA